MVTILSALDMSNIDIQTIELDSLVNASNVVVDISLPKPQRVANVIKQMNGNPYFFKSGNIVVKVGFADTSVTIDERIEDYLRTL